MTWNFPAVIETFQSFFHLSVISTHSRSRWPFFLTYREFDGPCRWYLKISLLSTWRCGWLHLHSFFHSAPLSKAMYFIYALGLIPSLLLGNFFPDCSLLFYHCLSLPLSQEAKIITWLSDPNSNWNNKRTEIASIPCRMNDTVLITNKVLVSITSSCESLNQQKLWKH